MNTAKLDTFQGDSLDDLLGERSTTIRPAVVPPASYKPQDFSEPCRSCRGTGTFTSYRGRAVGPCFKCKGAGKLTFKTSPDARAASRASAEASKARKAVSAIETFKAEYPDVWAWMDGSTFEIAQKFRADLERFGSLTVGKIEAARSMIAKRNAAMAAKAELVASAPVADAAGVDRLKAAFDAAIAYTAAKGRGMKLRNPKITIGAMVISPAKATSANPGALYVKAGATYLGKIVGGRFMASRDCSADQQARVLAFVADPKAAAKAYGIETGTCCICNATLTNAESKELGIGPICATKMGW